MKKFLLFNILVLFAIPSFASLRQSEYRWRNDNGDEISATWKAASNTPVYLTDETEIIRLRLEFDNINDVGLSSLLDQYLYYSKDGGSTWVQITNSELNDFKMVNSSFVAHGSGTTNLMGTGLGTFITGVIVSDETPDLSFDLFDGQRTEIEWVIQPTVNCESLVTYLFEMFYWEASGIQAVLHTDFNCENPEVTINPVFERCGPGRFDLEVTSATEDLGVNWWDSPAEGTLIGTGATFITPEYAANTTIYMEAYSGGCFNERIPIELIVRDVPEFDINIEDGVYCAFNNKFSIGITPEQASSSYLWSNGATAPSINIPPSFGEDVQYWVEVENEWGCKKSDTVDIVVNPSPNVDLGPDTVVCEGSSILLDAGSEGTDFYWNNGETTQIIEIDESGGYSVLVTNEYGCMGTDTLSVAMEGFAPTIEGITVDNLGPNTFQFTPFLPMYVISYLWDFGDGTATTTAFNPTHSYLEPGTYLITLEVSSTCGQREYYTYTTIVQSVDNYELSQNNLKIYPIPATQLLNISTVGGLKMNQLTVINILGQEAIHMDLNQLETYQLDVSNLASGVYQIKIESDKGILIRKFNITK